MFYWPDWTTQNMNINNDDISICQPMKEKKETKKFSLKKTLEHKFIRYLF